jgi:hypothetical protein
MGVPFRKLPSGREGASDPDRATAGRIDKRYAVRDDLAALDRQMSATGISRQLDLYPPSGWRIIQDFAAAASSIPE